jgi:neutral ceramidase
MIRFILLSAAVVTLAGFARDVRGAWRAGAGQVVITPQGPLWMTGYASRMHPSTGVVYELHAKALALDDGSGRPAVLVTMDILGVPADVAARIAEKVRAQYAIPRDRLILSCSHTHGGPMLAEARRAIVGPRISPEEWEDVVRYTRWFEDRVVEAVGLAIKAQRPASVQLGRTKAEFAMNRRLKTEKGYVIGVNPEGPVDHEVPLLVVKEDDGQPRAIVFGYACHNTTCGGDIYTLHGDYAGYAQLELERRHPGALALFVEGCGGDANPAPRGTLDLARQHGTALAEAVSNAVRGELRPVSGPLKCACDTVPAAFAAPPAREALQAQSADKDMFKRWYAQEMLKVLDRDGRLPSDYPYVLSAWQFGKDLTLVAMSGEVVVDFDLRLKKELGADRLWVAGYCNDVFAYIPSRRVLEEGGYEASGAMLYYCQPGPFSPSVEDTIVAKIHNMVDTLRGGQ